LRGPAAAGARAHVDRHQLRRHRAAARVRLPQLAAHVGRRRARRRRGPAGGPPHGARRRGVGRRRAGRRDGARAGDRRRGRGERTAGGGTEPVVNALLALPIVLPLFGAAASVLAGRSRRAQRAIGITVLTAVLGIAIALLVEVDRNGTLASSAGGWPAP